MDATRQRWEQHWASALSDGDVDFLANTAHITSIRLPIGYFTLGPSFTAGTPFSGSPSQIYVSAWSAVIQLCERLHKAGISVLLDLHAVPGGANDQDYGGTSSKKAELWGKRKNLEASKKCLLFIAEEVASERVKGCLGIQFCNEASWDARERGMYAWYEDVVSAIGNIDRSIPLYVSDAWDLGSALRWMGGINRVQNVCNPVGVDTHKYYTFTDSDKAQSPQQIIGRVGNELADAQGASGDVLGKGAMQVVVGEWSCVMDGQTWAKSNGADKDELVRQFGSEQAQKWRQRGGGAFFWTAKMQWMDGGEWGLFEMVKKGALVPPSNFTVSFEDVRQRAESARQQKEERKTQAVGGHVGYWDRTAPGGKFEHWRFEQGWEMGFSDALAFYEMRACEAMDGARSGADTIGALDLWVLKRLRESGQQGGFAWEWEHGFREGVRGFEESAHVG